MNIKVPTAIFLTSLFGHIYKYDNSSNKNTATPPASGVESALERGHNIRNIQKTFSIRKTNGEVCKRDREAFFLQMTNLLNKFQSILITPENTCYSL